MKLKWHDASKEKPECSNFTGCSESVLIVRDCGKDSVESYAVSIYRRDGWRDEHGGKLKYKWLDQEINGYRVTKWAYLGPSKSITLD